MSSWWDINTSPFIEPETLGQAPIPTMLGLDKTNVNETTRSGLCQFEPTELWVSGISPPVFANARETYGIGTLNQ